MLKTSSAVKSEVSSLPLFGPKVLLSLFVAPRSRSTASLQEVEDLLLPSVEADSMHKPTLGAVFIVALYCDVEEMNE